MNGAIFYSGKYGSTKQYADWIGKATGFPVFDIKDPSADPSKYDYLILGSSIEYFKLTIRKWVKDNLPELSSRSKILFSVSGAGPSDKLNGWVNKSFPAELLQRLDHIALGGRLDHSKVSWGVKLMLWIGSLLNPDPAASKEERLGFDHVNKDSIEPILQLVEQFNEEEIPMW